METKSRIRKEVLALRDGMSDAERKRADLLMTERILGHQWFYGAETLLAFASYGSEISTDEILAEALRTGKKVYLPRVEGEEMHFYRVHSPEELVEGYRGIREPAGDTERFVYRAQDCDRVMMLMPGAVFDRYRNRIGYGKGFYDRYLSDKPQLQIRTIAIGYACQLAEGELPTEVTDIRPYQVIVM